MNLSRYAPRWLIPPLALALAATLLGCASWLRLQAAQRQLDELRHQRQQSLGKNRQLIEETLQQAKTEQQRAALAELDVFVPPMPEQWSKKLASAQHSLRIPALHPTFGESTPWQATPSEGPLWIGLPINLELELLHEQDLLKLLQELNKYSLLIVRQCALNRAPAGENQHTPDRLHARCDLIALSAKH